MYYDHVAVPFLQHIEPAEQPIHERWLLGKPTHGPKAISSHGQE